MCAKVSRVHAEAREKGANTPVLKKRRLEPQFRIFQIWNLSFRGGHFLFFMYLWQRLLLLCRGVSRHQQEGIKAVLRPNLALQQKYSVQLVFFNETPWGPAVTLVAVVDTQNSPSMEVGTGSNRRPRPAVAATHTSQ